MAAWTPADIGDQSGRTFVVTGSNSGIGLEAARELVRAGAHVVLAVRDTEKGARAAAEISVGEKGTTEVRTLDLADLSSVRAFVAGLDGPVDVLINNAGLMAIPERRTADGFEMQIGTNFLGHFALTLLLLPTLRDRVVTISSPAHRMGRIDLADLNWEHRTYRRWAAYGQSKLADLMFTFELDRRLSANGSTVRSVAAHPGYAATELQFHTEALEHRVMGLGNRLFAQSADDGARPALYAATMPDVRGGDYWGPDGLGEMRGHPKRVGAAKRARDEAVARRLWDLAAQLTGVALR